MPIVDLGLTVGAAVGAAVAVTVGALPSLRTSVFVPKTCARRVSSFRGARGKKDAGVCVNAA